MQIVLHHYHAHCHSNRVQVAKYHGCCLLDGFPAQTTVSSGCIDKTATEEDIHSDLANSLPLEMLRRGAATRQ